jgi:glycosyltransferase involved in cell wall biosynthesis
MAAREGVEVDRLTITAILTTHRRPDLLPRALRSLAAELRRPDEILVVEDGDDPATVAAIRAEGIACRLVQRPVGGVARARNLGLREAGCEWVIYLDDDDIAYPGRCRALEAAALRRPCALVYGSTLKLTPESARLVPTHHPAGEGPARFRDFLRCMPHTNSILIRRKDLLDCGGFVEGSSYFSDWCALLHLLDRLPASAYGIPLPLAEFQARDEGMTQAVARDNAMRAKVLEAFDCLRLVDEQNRRALQEVRRAVELASPFHDYDAYVALAARHI